MNKLFHVFWSIKKSIEFLDNHKTIENTLFGSIILKEKIQEFQSKITQFGHNYVEDLVDVSVFLENKCRSLEKMILQIKSSFNDTEHKSYIKLIDDGVNIQIITEHNFLKIIQSD